MKARILWVEKKRANSPPFVPILRKKDYEVETVTTGSAALERLRQVEADLLVVNAASLRTSGKHICRDVREKWNGLPILLIVGAEQSIPQDACANSILKLPFTTRKLLNRIIPLLPGDELSSLEVGSIHLDLALRKVRCEDREARLTPRLTKLLKILMQHAGEVVEREKLFRQAWNTHYTEDTRTLDVHMSWLRQAIEQNPRSPRFLKTIRGVGYRLDA